MPALAPADTAPPVWKTHVDSVVHVVGAVTPFAGPLVLVGHSAAGRLIPLVAERVEAAACVFVDAQLPGFPEPGGTDDDWFLAHVRSIANDGVLPPWSEWWGKAALEGLVPDPDRRAALESALPCVPLASVEEVPPTPTTWRGPAAYLQLSAVYESEAADATRRGWPVTSTAGTPISRSPRTPSPTRWWRCWGVSKVDGSGREARPQPVRNQSRATAWNWRSYAT